VTACTSVDALSAAADSVSDGDLIDVSIRRHQNWELLNVYGVLSSIRPASLACGNIRQLNFPRSSFSSMQID
jgi:hypothetical protein